MAHTLYIIGNGFDLHHKLKTKYQHFAFYLQEKHTEIYDLLLKYYGLTDLDPKDESSLWDPLWGDFENALAEFDFESVLDDNTDFLPDYGSDDFRDRDNHAYQFEMEGIVNKLTKNLFQAFKEFILEVEFPEPKEDNLLKLENNAMFLNFNYTDTLENYYGINRRGITYIHGRAKTDDDPTILGHGIDPGQFDEEPVKEPVGLSEDELFLWREEMADGYDAAYESGKEELKSYFSASYKSTGELIEKNDGFFSSLTDVQKVIVLGHSISEVDQPYFHKVIESIAKKDITWSVSYYSDAEKITLLQNLINLGLKENQIDLIKTEVLQLEIPTLFNK